MKAARWRMDLLVYDLNRVVLADDKVGILFVLGDDSVFDLEDLIGEFIDLIPPAFEAVLPGVVIVPIDEDVIVGV